MKKLASLFLLVAALAVVSGCTVLDSGPPGSYPADNYPQYQRGGGHGGHSH